MWFFSTVQQFVQILYSLWGYVVIINPLFPLQYRVYIVQSPTAVEGLAENKPLIILLCSKETMEKIPQNEL